MDLPCSKCKTECLSELLGTYLLVLLGPASIIIVALSRIQPVPAALFVAFSFGAMVGLVILVGGKYSDAYVNPAVTVAAAVARELRSNLFLHYVCFQLTGGVLAGRAMFRLKDPLDIRRVDVYDLAKENSCLTKQI